MELLSLYALQFVGLPYLWGGSSPMRGFDCSGLCRHILHSQGVSTGDASSAAQLYEFFKTHKVEKAQAGALVFYADATGIVDHVALALNEHQHIEAAGGDRTTTCLHRAMEQDAFIRITPIRQQGRVAIVMPEYPFRDAP